MFYSVFRSGSAWRSGKSCKYEGGELNCSRNIVVIALICFAKTANSQFNSDSIVFFGLGERCEDCKFLVLL